MLNNGNGNIIGDHNVSVSPVAQLALATLFLSLLLFAFLRPIRTVNNTTRKVKSPMIMDISLPRLYPFPNLRRCSVSDFAAAEANDVALQ